MDTVPYHAKLWKAYHDSTSTPISALDTVNRSDCMYLYMAFFVGVLVTVLCVTVVNFLTRPGAIATKAL